MANRNIKTTIRMLTILVCVLLLTASSFTVFAQGSSSEQKTVRVGYYEDGIFQQGAYEGGSKDGYSYEYLNRVAAITGWTYEYVYGTWGEMYDAFLAGDVDLLAGLAYNEDRLEYMNYPDYPQGYEYEAICIKEGRTDITTNPKSLNGKRIGVLFGNIEKELNKWLAENQIQAEAVVFDSSQAMDDALLSEQVDAMVGESANFEKGDGIVPIIQMDSTAYYLTVAKDRTDLLEELNAALDLINQYDPNFVQNLTDKYYSNDAVYTQTEEESEWIKNHDTLVIGYLDHYLPYSSTDENGNPTGSMVHVFNHMIQKLGLEDQLKPEFAAYEDYNELAKALTEGTVDVAFPVQGTSWMSEQKGIYHSSDIVQSQVNLVFAGSYTEKTAERVAVNRNNATQEEYARILYPDSEILYVDTVEQCLESVLSGKATCTILDGYRVQGYLSKSEFSRLRSVALAQSCNVSCGVKAGNKAVLLLIERGIASLEEDCALTAIYGFSVDQTEYTLTDYIRDHAFLSAIVCILIAGVIAATASSMFFNKKRLKEKEQEEEIVRNALAAAEHANAAKSEFLFNMSHDIRTPMNAIMGFAKIMENELDEPEKLKEYLRKLQESGTYLLSIINNVLDMAKIESGNVELNIEFMDLLDNDSSVIDIFESDLKKKKLQFVCVRKIE